VDKYEKGLSGNQIKLDVHCDQKAWVPNGKKDQDGDRESHITSDFNSGIQII
jgi:hypothetical protein